jgi:GAF domain-containing protein
VLDASTDPEYAMPDYQHVANNRTMLGVPLLRHGVALGSITLWKTRVEPFTEKQIELITTFADQAVIAIENARLLNELRQRTDDLSESLEQQTATANVLEVISRSAFDLQAVFETLAESSVKLCAADRSVIYRLDGELLKFAAAFNVSRELTEWIERNPIEPSRHGGAARAALERRTVHIPDILADPEYTYGSKTIERFRTVLGVPILKGDEVLGVILIYRLGEVRPFTDKQITLVETFADQAAIAIENVRLLDVLRQRTDDLTESLDQQTATSEILEVISNSPTDSQPAFDAIVRSGLRLFPNAVVVIRCLTVIR